MTSTAPTRRAKPSEEGYVLLAVMLLLALLIISMTVAMPKVAQDIQRDRELETFHRGMQYRRAIQLYYRKFNRYPPNIDALVKTNEIRFLRKKYIDPTTGKDDWKPVMFGQNKTPMAMGFFGQPLGGVGATPIAGVGPAGGNGMPGASTIGSGSSLGSGSSFGSSGSGFGSTGSSFGSSGSSFGSTGSSFGSTGSSFGSTGTSGTTGTSTGAPGTTTGTTDANGNPTDPNANGGQIAGASPIGGQSFGGAGIIGVSPASDKQSIFVYKKKNHYNEWEFLYSPLSDMGALGMPQAPPLQPSQPGAGAPGTPFSPSATGGAGVTPSPTSPTQPTTPQQ